MHQTRPKRIAIIADTYPPLRISGAVQMRDLVREFADQGHHPTVIVPAAGLDRPWRLEHADAALYQAKREGRNRAIAWFE